MLSMKRWLCCVSFLCLSFEKSHGASLESKRHVGGGSSLLSHKDEHGASHKGQEYAGGPVRLSTGEGLDDSFGTEGQSSIGDRHSPAIKPFEM